MAFSGQDIAALTAVIMKYYDRLLIKRLEASLVFAQFAERRPLPKNSGNTITFTRYTNFSAVTKLTEGEVPTVATTSAANVSATLEQFGGYTKVSDMLEMTAIDNQIESVIDLFGYQAALTIDTRIRDGLYGTSGIPSGAKLGLVYYQYADKTSPGALSTVTSAQAMDIDQIKNAAFNLRRLNARRFADGYYVMVAHPNTIKNLESDSNWRSWNQYQAKDTMWKGEAGNIFGVKVIESTNITSTTSGTASAGATAFFSPVLGMGCYAITEFDGGVHTYVKTPNLQDTSNPLNQWSTVGWKVTFATQVLHPSAGVVLVTADQ